MPPVRHQKFRDALKRSRDAHDKVEAWLFDEVDHVLNGGQCIKYFAAGRCSDATTFCACLASEKDTHGLSYQLAFRDLLRNAGERVKVRTKHKLTFDNGTLIFTSDGRGQLYGLVCSDRVGSLASVYDLLFNLMELFENCDMTQKMPRQSNVFIGLYLTRGGG